MAISGADRAAKFETAGWVFLFIFAASDFFSISVAQIAAAGMGVAWAGRWIASGKRPDLSPLKIPLAAFVAASLVSAAMSLDPAESIKDSKDLLHIFIFFAAFDLFSKKREMIGVAFRVAAGAGGAIALVGMVQAIMRGVDIYDRISGFSGMYMTYAGLLMLAFIVGLAVALFAMAGWRDAWLPLALGLMAVALLLSLTRNAWVGAFAGSLVIIAARKPAALLAVPVVAALAFAFSPPEIKGRVMSMFDAKKDKSNRERIYLWTSGLKILADYPVFGVGQNSFPLVYPKYRNPGVKEPDISHLHNNFLEIGVERGLTGLAAWLSIWITALWTMSVAWKRARQNGTVAPLGVTAALGSIIAFLSAGMFEYNFGDSEIQMFIYFLLAAGMAASAGTETGGQQPE